LNNFERKEDIITIIDEDIQANHEKLQICVTKSKWDSESKNIINNLLAKISALWTLIEIKDIS
jgi:hypothetical protein